MVFGFDDVILAYTVAKFIHQSHKGKYKEACQDMLSAGVDAAFCGAPVYEEIAAVAKWIKCATKLSKKAIQVIHDYHS